MEWLFDLLINYKAVLIALFRVSGVFLIAPIFSSTNVPMIFRIGLSFFLSLVVAPFVSVAAFDYSTLQFVFILLKEVLIGYAIGYIIYLFFSAYYIAGQIMDMQVGFGMVNVFDPLSNIQVPILGNLFYIMTILFFFIFNGHHKLIEALVYSFQSIPTGTWIGQANALGLIVNTFANIFAIGFKIGLPIIAALFITDIILGILARTVPQMNVFVVGMPAKLLAGFLLLTIIISVYFAQIEVFFEKMFEALWELIR